MPFRFSRLPVEIAAFALASLSLASLAATGRADDCVNGPAGSGHASSFTYTPGSGACRFGGEEGNAFVAAVGPTDYAGSAMCGRFVRVTGPLGWVDVRVVDECASCAAGDVRLDAQSFAAIADPGGGAVAVTWQTIPSPEEGDVILYLGTSNTNSFLQIQPRDFRYGIASLEYLSPSGYVAARRETYDYFTIDASIGVPVPLTNLCTIRLTDVNGQPMVVNGIPLASDHTHPAGAQFPWCASTDTPVPPPPRALALHLPSPNPFHRSTRLAFDLPRDGHVELRLYDASGRRVRTLVDARLSAGRHELAWPGSDDAGRPLASGVYFCRLSSGGAVDQQRVVISD